MEFAFELFRLSRLIERTLNLVIVRKKEKERVGR